MKIRQLKVMRGPNIWSDYYHRLIVIKLDLYDEDPDRLDIKKLLDRFESQVAGKRSAARVPEAEKKVHSLAELVGYVAWRLQVLAWMDVSYYAVHPTRDRDVYHVVCSYIFVEAGEWAMDAAVHIVEALIDEDEEYDIMEDVVHLQDMHHSLHMGLSTTAVAEAAENHGIPFTKLSEYSMLGYGAKQKRIQATIASTTAHIGIDLTGDKDATKRLLRDFSLPAPEGVTISKEENLSYAIQVVGFPLVVKPLDGNHGRGITVNITNYEDAVIAFKIAQKVSKIIIVEKFLVGTDYRLLVINYKFIGALKRVPAFVVGDGYSTIGQLIEEINKDPSREERPGNLLKKISVDETTLNLLRRNNLNINSVLEEGRKLFVKETANVSNAAVPIDVTDEMHPHNILQAERIARVVGLDICGIDLMSPDLSVPFHENGAAVVEVNAAPGIRMHMTPAIGKGRDAAGAIVSMLFPKGTPFSIPIVAVTGTNGKTTTVRLIAHIANTAKYNTGYTTTDGIYLNNMMIESGDCSGPKSADYLLKDPTVEFAVLECARGGILREGLAFRHCDVGIVTNVTSDHLGIGDIHTIEELAHVKSVVPKSVKKGGHAVLNADDDRVFEMADHVKCDVALFSSTGYTERIKDHCERGGLACIFDENGIVLMHGKERTMVEEVQDIPLTFNGTAKFNIDNVLASVLAAYVQDINIEHIREGLRTFVPSPELTPGRMNTWNFRNFEVILDYAHNAAGIEATGDFLKTKKAARKIAVLSGPGDRSDEDLITLGSKCAKIFDEIIIREDGNLRGRTGSELSSLLSEGVKSVKPDLPVKVIPKLAEAIQYAMEHAPKNSIIVVYSEKVNETIDIIQSHKAAEGPEPGEAGTPPERESTKDRKRKRNT